MKKKDLITPLEIQRIKKEIKDKETSLEELFFSESYKNYFLKSAFFITRKNIKVIFDKNAETASTNGETVFINPLLFINKKSFEEITLINLGFLAHELFHILFTDFSLIEEISNFKGNKKILHIIDNIIEDSAIEYIGCLCYTGDFKRAIIFLNETLFEKEPEIKDSDELSQILSYMSRYGSIQNFDGLNKSSKTVKEIFEKVKPFMDKSRISFEPKERFNCSIEIYKILEPLIKTQDAKYSNKKGEMRNETGSSNPLSKEEIEDLIKGEKKDSKKDSENNLHSEIGKTPDFQNLKTSSEKEVKDKNFEEEIKKTKEKKTEEISEKIKNEPIHSKIENRVKYENYEDYDISEYQDIFMKYKNIIDITKNKFKKLIKQQMPETLKNQRIGRISGKDLCSEKLFSSGKIFQKEKISKEYNLSISLLIDESGSMKEKERIYYAKLSAIIMKEVCDSVNIPTLIMGFNAKPSDSKVVHSVYCDFDSPKTDKYSLLKIRAKSDNRDGYSIRFAGEYINKRNPNKKNILIVISDGIPWHIYDSYTYENGLDDTKKQINYCEKKFNQTVIALNISGSPKYHEKMYKRVINIKEIEELPTKLITVLNKELKKI